MQFITGLFGGSGNTILTMIFALGIVLVLILLAAWLLRLVSNVSGNVARGRNRRLAVIDTLSVDQKRQLLIIRRDDVEHLVLIGGPQDLVVETGIPVPAEAPQSAPARRSLPTLGARKPAPATTRPTEPAVEAEPEIATPPAPAVAAPKTSRSLRHTGLLRPVTTQDPTVIGHNPDISAEPPSDSAKEDGNHEASEGDALEHETGTPANRP